MVNAGIDYGRGLLNHDLLTGCRFGVIPQNDLAGWAFEEFTTSGVDLNYEGFRQQVIDDLKSAVEQALDPYSLNASDDADKIDFDQMFDDLELDYEDDGAHYSLKQEGYNIQWHSDGDVWVLKSPVFTYAQFCSPCAPGAGHLSYPLPEDEGTRTYCLDKTWFEGDKCPYPYWDIKTGELIYSPASKE